MDSHGFSPLERADYTYMGSQRFHLLSRRGHREYTRIRSEHFPDSAEGTRVHATVWPPEREHWKYYGPQCYFSIIFHAWAQGLHRIRRERFPDSSAGPRVHATVGYFICTQIPTCIYVTGDIPPPAASQPHSVQSLAASPPSRRRGSARRHDPLGTRRTRVYTQICV